MNDSSPLISEIRLDSLSQYVDELNSQNKQLERQIDQLGKHFDLSHEQQNERSKLQHNDKELRKMILQDDELDHSWPCLKCSKSIMVQGLNSQMESAPATRMQAYCTLLHNVVSQVKPCEGFIVR